jgi:dimethylargininase
MAEVAAAEAATPEVNAIQAIADDVFARGIIANGVIPNEIKRALVRSWNLTEKMFTNAIVRLPAENFADGLTSGKLGKPSYARALTQHAAYRAALERCGLRVLALEADSRHPDSTFVEDAAIVTSRSAILARPGAESRRDEVAAIRDALAPFFRVMHQIEAPGTLDGGDVCEAGNHFFIGLSHRTNEDGARQLAEFLAADGFTSSIVEVRGMKGVLHLKSALACVGENTLVVWRSLADLPHFRAYDRIPVDPEESYAANCVRVNQYVLLPSGHPCLESALGERGYKTLPLDMSEFEKMDGGLSCLSLRF